MKREFLTASNLLSITRGLLSIPFVLVMMSERPDARLWGAAIIGVAILTDKFDGVLARRYHQETEWGKILDPLADKVGVASVALVLLWRNDLPLWFVGGLLARDVLIFTGGMYLRWTRKLILPSNQAGKWTIGVVAGTLVVALFGITNALYVFALTASSVMLVASFAMYVKRFIEVLQTPR